MKTRLLRHAGASIIVLLAARLCYLILRYRGTEGFVKRPHIESAALLFAIAGFVVRFATDDPGGNVPSERRPGIVLWLALVVGSLTLYWPALHIGLLSDDFILYQHALAWDVSQVAPQLFRPLPLFVWAIVVHTGGGPSTLHLLNILLHATNAYLTGRMVAGWISGPGWPMLAAFLVLTAPLGPEAVAWCSGAFDLFATTFALSAVLVARRPDAGWKRRIGLIAFTVAALLSKETAIVLPLLLAVDAWIRRSVTRRAIIDTAMVGVFAALFGLVRLQSATPVETSGFTRYRVQRLVFDSFGALAAPWHVQDPWLMMVRVIYALCVILLLTGFFMNRGERRGSTVALGGTEWVLASILPLLAFFHVGPQLEGARYLYLGASGWAGILLAASADLATRLPRGVPAARGAVAVLIGIGAWGVRQHLEPWTHAAALRDISLAAAAADQRLHECSPAYVEGLPDSVDGAYLFANGAREALAGVGVTAYARPGAGECAFRWDSKTGRFRSATGTSP